ncbi:MAG: glycosyltransferase [Oscillospiraceae bacterium]|nr:glycosyltransferase [Oscillospiraceae bacterium]
MDHTEKKAPWEQALISIIVPVYNVEAYVVQCIESILAQTWKNWELILIDDGSPDRSGEICDAYAGEHENIRVIHQANRGVSAARNVGIEAAKGEYLFFADPDDWLAPEMLEGMMAAGQGAELVVCGHTNVYMQADGTEKRRMERRIWEGRDTPLETTALDDDVMAKTAVLWNKLYRRDAVGALRFDESLSYGEDALFVAELLSHLHAAVLIDEPWYFYRKNRPGNVVSARPDPRTEQFLHTSLLIYRLMKARGSGVCGVRRVMIAIGETFAKVPWNERKKYAYYIKACGRTLRQTALRDRIRYARDARFVFCREARMRFFLKAYFPLYALYLDKKYPLKAKQPSNPEHQKQALGDSGAGSYPADASRRA